MNRAMRLGVIVLLALAIWPEFGRYHAEWLLADANVRLDRVLRGADRGESALNAADRARTQAHDAGLLLPADPRPPLLESVALILRRQGGDATRVLEAALAHGERPELTLNLGRARGISGDEAGAMAAFLRTAWASPGAIATLPAALRGPLLEQVNGLEIELRAGRLGALPPLRPAAP